MPVLMCFFVLGFGLGPLWPSFFSMGLDNAGEFSGAGSGCVMLFSSLGGVVLPLILGVLAGFNIMIAGIVFLAVVLVFMQIYIKLTRKQ